MNLQELINTVREHGVVGAGGAGFPTYMKLDEKADTILLNCAECEPLLKLHRQLLEVHAEEIVRTFAMVADAVKAEEAIICVKEEYKATVKALEGCVCKYPKVSIKLLEGVYPMGDEVNMIYEALGRVVPPGGLPIQIGAAVFNVETIYNIYRAVEYDRPVTDKVVSIVAEVSDPVTVRVPLGMPLGEVVALAGAVTTPDPVYFVGGPMMGRIGSAEQPVSKTTNAVLVLPKDHLLINKSRSNLVVEMNRAASICCHCESCTDMCPRHLLGLPIEPHMFMRSAPNRDFQDLNPFVNTYFCCSCGICELYACPQGLSPRSLMLEYKAGLKKAGVPMPKGLVAKPVSKAREYRKIPEERLEARLGLRKYNVDAPLDDNVVGCSDVRVSLSQHIGAPAVAVVRPGDRVATGQMIAEPAKGLSVAIHASIDGMVTEVTNAYVRIQKIEQEGRDGE